MRIMGLDVGDRRIGVAISDPLLMTAQPITVIERRNVAQDLETIGQLARQYEVETMVVGLPLNMNGTLGPKAQEVQEFAYLVAGNLNLKLEFFDERLTTKEAEAVLLKADVSRAKRKRVIDKLAAVKILQAYLDRRASGDTNP